MNNENLNNNFNALFNQNNVMNAIEILSFILTVQNLYENREQSEQNDIQAANDKQARYLLKEMNKKFDEQNQMIRKIMVDIDDIKRTMNAYEIDV